MKKLLIIGFSFLVTTAVTQLPKTASAADYSVRELLECQIDATERREIAKNFTKEMKERGVPLKNNKGAKLNKELVLNLCIAGYGPAFDRGGDPPYYENGKRIYRYNGKSMSNYDLPNFYYPDDTPGIPKNYVQIIKFRSNPWDYKSGINVGRKPRVLWGDPRWAKKSQINLNDTRRITELGKAVDMNYVMKSKDFDQPQRYLLAKNAYGTYYIKNALGKELSKYANILEYPTKFTAGTFAMYRKGTNGVYYYSIYMLPQKEPVFVKSKLDDLYVKDYIAYTPSTPRKNDEVSIKVKIGNTSPQKKTYKNVKVKFGWKEFSEYWCTTIPEIKPGQELTLTFDKTQVKKCNGTTDKFDYPSVGGKRSFYVEVNYDKTNPPKEVTFTNNQLTKYIEGDLPSTITIQSVNCAPSARFCIKAYPTYPSSNTEGGEGSYYKVRYDYKVTRQGSANIIPVEVITQYTITDPKKEVILTGMLKKSIPSSCIVGINLSSAQACKMEQYFVADAEHIFNYIPEKQKIHFKNVGKYSIEFTSKEKRVMRYYTTSCNEENVCTRKLNQREAPDLQETVILPFKVTGVSSGSGDF